MRNFVLLILGLGVATFLVSSQAPSKQSELTISKTKERIWSASVSNNG